MSPKPQGTDDIKAEVARWNGYELALGLRAVAASTGDELAREMMREAARRLVGHEETKEPI
jgi:hypothetical protein